MPVYCGLCQRSFKEQRYLDQHINDSPAHKSSPQAQLNLQSSMQPNLQTSGRTVHQQTASTHAIQINQDQTESSHFQVDHTTACEQSQNVRKPYECCWTSGIGPDARGCQTLPTHDFQLSLRSMRHQDFQQTPPPSRVSKFRAVVLDCEMAGVVGGGAGEAILLCVIDYITGAVILNQFIYPTERINDMRSSIHGISTHTLNDAASKGKALDSWKEARSELWKYIDSDTILVGHALENDLNALRLIHYRVVDSAILSKNEVGCNHTWGLKFLCSELLNLDIRKNESGIHDCLEDVLATREVVLFCTQEKLLFRNWADIKKIEQKALEKEIEQKREIARQKKMQESQAAQKD
ncbi:hypothetical protein SBOR_10130 [Sclerotinia borealis F-4128]|uniref:Exonuclease domain-containing protein n=1 Tax=Sclerotinia borealis (strain F-4128) TaxID=1432307 RepID=W9C4J1_SCLBF|nr:hypothetical protein SBOR_10130 [Sclerotinia borealis F-4128]